MVSRPRRIVSGRRSSRSVRMILLAMAIAVSALTMSGVSAGPACACSCAPMPASELVDRASALALGTAVAKYTDDFTSHYTVEVRQSYKQRLPSRITVVTASSSAACGIDWELGEERVVVLGGPSAGPVDAGKGEWSASLCNNLRLSLGEATQYAGPSIEPLAVDDDTGPDDGVSTGMVVGVGAAALVAAGAVTAWWWYRRRSAR